MLSEEELPRMKPGKVAGLIVGALLILTIPVLVYYLVLHKSYETLLSNIGEQELGQVVDTLDAQNILYEYKPEEMALLVDSEQLHQARMALASYGALPDNTTGFELFDDTGYGMSGFTQKINFQRALQGELERSVSSLNSVKSSRVHLVLPDQTLFRDRQGEASASVILMMMPGAELSPEQVQGIQKLISSAVPQLTRDSIVISNSYGQALTLDNDETATASTQLSYKKSVEQYYEDKLLRIVEKVIPAGDVVVTVDAMIDFTAHTMRRENAVTTNNGQGILIKSRKITEYQDPKTEGKKSSSNLLKESVEEDFHTGTELSQTEQKPGKLKSLNVSVLIASDISSEATSNLKELLSKAAGLNNERGDSIIVTSLMPVASYYESMVNVPVSPLTDSVVKQAPAVAPERLKILPSDIALAFLAFIVLLAAVVFYRMQSRRLPDQERALILKDVQSWLEVKDEHSVAKS